MFNKLIQRLLGNNTEHELKKMWPIVRRINDLEPKLAGLSDASLQEKTFEFKNRLANGETLDDILPEAFAVVREASRRVTGMRYFDVQLSLTGTLSKHSANVPSTAGISPKRVLVKARPWSRRCRFTSMP